MSTAMSLEAVRAELQSIIGTALYDDADRQRRQMLWWQLDRLIATRSGMKPYVSNRRNGNV